MSFIKSNSDTIDTSESLWEIIDSLENTEASVSTEVSHSIEMICDNLDTKLNNSTSSKQLIEFVRDRPGHDRRYAIDSTKIRSQLGWIPTFDIEAGIDITVDWYLANEAWLDNLSEKATLKNRFTS